MSRERIGMAVGGDRLDGVMGRSEEEEEMLVLEDGAFQIAEGGGGRKLGFRRGQSLASDDFLENYVDQGKRHPVRNLMGSIRVVKPGESRRDQLYGREGCDDDQWLWSSEVMSYLLGECNAIALHFLIWN
ncbi:beta-1,2-xylosyltransferase-like [Eucalyptus grandis]|uniref:beta-1,2-xylosyltransferase-like n=1 Tax=Eucalyptus grandis TaxID=71139 RepID=UPI00192ECBB6|nr:beta-1,2-xylosyltransferase-like [Eucalyptus grandis]